MKSERSVGIDCLRAISIIWVLLYHFVPLQVFNRGTFGVLLFFIISGYCIAFSVETSQSAWHFFAKRLGRLLPALIVCGFLTTLFKYLAPELVEPGRGLKWIHYAYTLVALPTLNVLQVNYNLPDGAYWSLQIEFQFYVFCFLMMALGLKKRLLALLCAMTVFRTLTTSTDYYTSNDFFPFFISGMSVAALVRGRTKEAIAGIFVAFSVDLYHLTFHVKQPSVPIEMYRSLLLWLGTAAVYLAARYDHVLPRPFRALAFIGVISYPLYLIHQDVGIMILHWAQVGRDSATDWLIRAIILPAFLAGIAWLVYALVERPTIKPLTAFLAGPRAWLRQWQPVKIRPPADDRSDDVARQDFLVR
ncbi:acyltransferase family protein [Bradyrhizobium diazoefficiens]|uniref:acyltransferase family protein n=1 Tax=Bradyrhizobium diazoefficiens TaxID=1355477 RepID=UPI0027146E3E|nr:acyltransferase [Bradyrhizobium diazoefficiens]WLA53310.1 acyltransferase [Bradyrhizobium diazoefficiens]